MLIAVEATRLLREERGIGRYVRALLPRLVAQRPDVRLVLFAAGKADAAALTAKVASDPALAGRVEVRRLREMSSSKADVFWYPWNITRPLTHNGPMVPTLHDVYVVAHPDPRRIRNFIRNNRLRFRYRRTVRRATLVLCISQFTADEAVRVLGADRAKLRVARSAGDDRPTSPPEQDAALLTKLGVKAPFVLAVGASERRKNLHAFVRAMRRVVAERPDVTLVMAGPHRFYTEGAPPDWLKMVGYVSEAELNALYRSTDAYVMPSTYEGFGLPVLEAMQLGAPVLCARASSLPEVAGDAAEYFEPTAEAEMATAILRVLNDGDRRTRMQAASLARAAQFSWDETARRTLEIFDEAMAKHRAATASSGRAR